MSYAAMAERQQHLADAILKDPDVESLSSFIGVDGTNSTLNSGRFLIDLKPADERKAGATESSAACRRDRRLPASRSTCSRCRTCDRSQVSATQYQFMLENPTSRSCDWTPKLMQAQADRRDRRRRQRLQPRAGGRRRLDRARRRVSASRRRPSTTRSTTPTASASSRPSSPNRTSTASSLRPTRAARIRSPRWTTSTCLRPPRPRVRCRCRSIGFAQGPDSRRYRSAHLEQFPVTTISFNFAPGASLGGRSTRSTRAADVGLPRVRRQFPGRGAGVPVLAVERAVPVLAAILGDVYRARRALRELHPSGDDPLDAAVGRHRRAAGAGTAGAGLDIIGVIGIVLLIGIVKKNAIMMIDFALECRAQRGHDARARRSTRPSAALRPIMMTTMAALFGALPLALDRHRFGVAPAARNLPSSAACLSARC